MIRVYWDGSLIGVRACDCVDFWKAVIGQVIKSSSDGMRDVEFDTGGMLDVEFCRNTDFFERQELDSRREQEVDVGGFVDGLVGSEIGVEEAGADILPKEISDSFGRAKTVPVRATGVFCFSR